MAIKAAAELTLQLLDWNSSQRPDVHGAKVRELANVLLLRMILLIDPDVVDSLLVVHLQALGYIKLH